MKRAYIKTLGPVSLYGEPRSRLRQSYTKPTHPYPKTVVWAPDPLLRLIDSTHPGISVCSADWEVSTVCTIRVNYVGDRPVTAYTTSYGYRVQVHRATGRISVATGRISVWRHP